MTQGCSPPIPPRWYFASRAWGKPVRRRRYSTWPNGWKQGHARSPLNGCGTAGSSARGAGVGGGPAAIGPDGGQPDGFLLEAIGGGVEDGDVLDQQGGLWPRAVLTDGEWWRLASRYAGILGGSRRSGPLRFPHVRVAFAIICGAADLFSVGFMAGAARHQAVTCG